MTIRKTIRYLSLLLLGTIVWYVLTYHKSSLSPENIELVLLELGVLAPVIFIGIYAAFTVLFLPGAAITLLGGFLFGPFLGTLYNLIGATIGATIAFLLARFIFGSWVEQAAEGKLKKLKDGVDKEGWKFVAIVRLIPILPFNVLNYALGLTKIKLKEYIVASFVFMAPACFVYTYIGSLGDDIATGELKNMTTQILIATGLLILLVCIPWFVKLFKDRD